MGREGRRDNRASRPNENETEGAGRQETASRYGKQGPPYVILRLWPGETFVCVASGPSLTQAQVDYCRGKARVIVINNNWERAPWADVLYACDKNWWKKYCPKFDGLCFSAELSEQPGVVLLQCEANKSGLSKDPSMIFAGGNGGHQALNLAFHLGAARIVLIGYDMKFSVSGNRHWHERHPQGLNNPDEVTFQRWIPALQAIAADLKTAGVEVINCSIDTALDCFPRARLEEVL